MLTYFVPEILILFGIMSHIQKEIMVGLIDRKEQPEDIKDALIRYIKYKNGKDQPQLQEFDLFDIKFSKDVSIYNARNVRSNSFHKITEIKYKKQFENLVERKEDDQFPQLAAEDRGIIYIKKERAMSMPADKNELEDAF